MSNSFFETIDTDEEEKDLTLGECHNQARDLESRVGYSDQQDLAPSLDGLQYVNTRGVQKKVRNVVQVGSQAVKSAATIGIIANNASKVATIVNQGGGVSAVVEAAKSAGLNKGWQEVAGAMATKGAENVGTLSILSKAVRPTVAQQFGGTLTRTLASKSTWLITAATFGVELAVLSWQYCISGTIKERETFWHRVKTSFLSNVASVCGGALGSAIGCVVGNLICPGVGGLIGMGIGQLIGGVAAGLGPSYYLDRGAQSIENYAAEHELTVEQVELSYDKSCQILGLPDDPKRILSKSIIERATKSQYLLYHPDKNQNEPRESLDAFQQKFIEVRVAYTVIQNYRQAKGTWK